MTGPAILAVVIGSALFFFIWHSDELKNWFMYADAHFKMIPLLTSAKILKEKMPGHYTLPRKSLEKNTVPFVFLISFFSSWFYYIL
jgi:hypothetical protein